MSKRKQRRKNRKKLLQTFILIVISITIYKVCSIALKASMSNDIYRNMLGEAVLAVCGILSAYYLHRMDMFALKKDTFADGIAIMGLPLLTIVLNVDLSIKEGNLVQVSKLEVLAFFVEMLLIGVAEEIQFRGLIQNALHEYFGEKTLKDQYIAIFITAGLFGSVHMINVFSGVSVWSAFCQALSAAMIGLLFCTAYYRSNKNLWAVILVHGAMDGAALLHNGYLQGIGEAAIVDSNSEFPWATILVYGIANLIALWPSKMRKHLH